MLDIPIITYHKISNRKEFGLTTVSKHKFETQMKYLYSHGYNTIRLKDLSQEAKLPEKPVIITFDDGYENIYLNAIPVLKKYNFKAVIFIVANYIGHYNTWEAMQFQQKYMHLTEDQIRRLRDEGHEIGSHSKMHNHLPTLSGNKLIDEIKGSKIKLEKLLDKKISSFCYPYGRFNEKIVNLVKEAGYRYATTNLKYDNKKNFNPFTLNRRSIYMTDSQNIFISKIKSQNTLNISYLTESIIQKGSIASIGLNILQRTKSNF